MKETFHEPSPGKCPAPPEGAKKFPSPAADAEPREKASDKQQVQKKRLEILTEEKEKIVDAFNACSTPKELRKAYKRLCKTYHPDTCKLPGGKKVHCALFDFLKKEYDSRSRTEEHLPTVLVKFNNFEFDILE